MSELMQASGGAPAADGGSPRLYAVMAALILVEVLGALESTMLASAMPLLIREFGDISLAAWVLSGYALAQAASAAIGGRLGDLYGRQRMLIVVVCICGVGSLISAVGPNLQIIILGRVLQGFAGAILPLCFGITREVVHRDRVPLWIGILTGAVSFSALFGYVFGGLFADAGHWAGIFVVTAALAVVSAICVHLFVPTGDKPSAANDEFDYWGVLYAPAMAVVLFGVSMGKSWGWASLRIWMVIGAGLVLIAGWAWYEAHHKKPLIDVRLLANRKILLGNLCGVFGNFAGSNLAFVVLLFMQQDPAIAGVGLAVSATMAGLLKTPSNVAAVIGAPLGGWMSGRYGSAWGTLFGGALLAFSWWSLSAFHQNLIEVVIISAICAAGSMMVLASSMNMVIEGAPRDRSSEVAGLTTAFRSLAGSVSTQVAALLLATATVADPKSKARVPTEAAYDLVFWTLGAAGFITAMMALLDVRKRVTNRALTG